MAVIEFGALADPQRVVDLGPEHPSRAGLLRLHLDTNSVGQISSVDLECGFMHRGVEKLFEVRDYRQVLMLADRHDWQAPFFGEWGVALACERLLGLTPPDRAVVLRALLAEVARIHSHLGFLTFPPFRMHYCEVGARVRHSRDQARELMQQLSGNRLHPMINRLGGLAVDADASWNTGVHEWLAELDTTMTELERMLNNAAWRELAAIAPLTQQIARDYGLSGPAVRAVGYGHDLRITSGEIAANNYTVVNADEVLIHRPDQPDATARGRFDQLAREIHQSRQLIIRGLQRAEQTPGPVNVALSKIIKVPDAETWVELESPWGVAGFHLVSRGGTTPWRLKLRTPTQASINAAHALLLGCPIDRVDIAMASVGWTMGDLDK